jgi:hypothetical protein
MRGVWEAEASCLMPLTVAAETTYAAAATAAAAVWLRRHVRGVWEAEASCLMPLITGSAHASSTDNEQQAMGA